MIKKDASCPICGYTFSKAFFIRHQIATGHEMVFSRELPEHFNGRWHTNPKTLAEDWNNDQPSTWKYTVLDSSDIEKLLERSGVIEDCRRLREFVRKELP